MYAIRSYYDQQKVLEKKQRENEEMRKQEQEKRRKQEEQRRKYKQYSFFTIPKVDYYAVLGLTSSATNEEIKSYNFV